MSNILKVLTNIFSKLSEKSVKSSQKFHHRKTIFFLNNSFAVFYQILTIFLHIYQHLYIRHYIKSLYLMINTRKNEDVPKTINTIFRGVTNSILGGY